MTANEPIVIGHRGAQTVAPENTMAAFLAARELGADAVELDVHLSRDGVLVVHHDYLLDKTTSGTGPIFDLDWPHLAQLDAGSWFSQEFEGERIPRLEQVFELDGLRFEVELKGYASQALERVLDLVETADLLERVELTSANVPMLAELRRRRPEVRTGLFTPHREPWMTTGVFEHTIVGWAMFSAEQVIHLGASAVTSDIVRRLHEMGKLVHAGDVRSAPDVERLVRLGVDQISSDDVAMAVNAREELTS
jgi:glycerophosphoryl diester phosphodiesterase